MLYNNYGAIIMITVQRAERETLKTNIYAIQTHMHKRHDSQNNVHGI